MNFISVVNKDGDHELINLDEVTYITVTTTLATFSFVSDRSLSFNPTLLGQEQFDQLSRTILALAHG